MNFLTADVVIKVDDKKLPQQLDRVERAVKKSATIMGNAFKKMGATFKAVFTKMVKVAKWAMLGIIGTMGYFIKLAMKQQDVEKRLAITLKATGYAAGFTAKQLLKQASALQDLTRFGDETITAMQTMLLTFKNIRGDIFEQATEAALDMAVAEAAVSGRMVDLTATSIRLGRALNDPIAGMNALSRVGVQFTETQKNMIRQMMRVGDVAGAQKIMLDELQSEFGGMAQDADTAAGALKQMWNAISDVGEIIGKPFLDSIKDSATKIKEWAQRNEERISKWAEKMFVYLTFVKQVFFDFISFLYTDWAAGWRFARDISIAAMKDASTEIVAQIEKLMKDIYTKLTTGWGGKIHTTIRDLFTIESLRDSTIGKIIRYPSKLLEPKIKPTEQELMGMLPSWQMQEPIIPSAISQVEIPEKLGESWMESVQNLQNRLEEIQNPVKELEEILDTSLVEPLGKAALEAEELNLTLDTSLKGLDAIGNYIGIWMKKAGNWGQNLGRIVTNAFSTMADKLADALMGMEMDWKAFGRMFIKQILAMIIQMQMLYVWQLLVGVPGTGTFAQSQAPTQGTIGFGGTLFGSAPSGQHGGEVTQTGLAKIHKGEVYSGVNNEMGFGGITVNNYVSDDIDVEVMDEERVINITRRASIQLAATDGSYRRAHKLG